MTPETWCFTLTHALRARLPIAAFDTGAIAERVRASQTLATLLPLETSAKQINDALLTLGGRSLPQEPKIVPVASVGQDHDAETPTSPETYRLQTLNTRSPAVAEAAMTDATINPKANVQLLPLAKGLYQFTVKSAAPRRPGGPTSVVLPAVQISLAPGVASNSVEYMTGLRTDGSWLFEANDVLIAKVKVDGTPILITSYGLKGSAPLQIEVERMDPARSAPAPISVANTNEGAIPLEGARPAAGAVFGAGVRRTEDGRRILPTRILAHISTRGDVAFVDQLWAGVLDQKRWIEGFQIEPLAGLTAGEIEYKGLTEKGIESPWIPGGGYCGTRRLNLALSGFSVRIKGPKARQLTCVYRGLFISGAVIGPLADGAPLRAPDLRDYLQAIELTFVEARAEVRPDALDLTRAAAAAPEPMREAPSRAIEGLAARSEPPPARPRRAVGPRFSVFRDDGE